MQMDEFLYPTFGEWVQEFEYWSDPRLLPREPVDLPRTVNRTSLGWLYTEVASIFHSALSLPPQRDYYRPERAALIVAELWELRFPATIGGLAFAVWMAEQKDIHEATS